MAVNNAGRPTVNFDDWMRNIEKRLMREERRPQYRSPQDVVGPGFGPYARQVNDWDSDGPQVGGHFFSAAYQVVNSPDDTKNWIGIVQANPYGQGLQRVWEYIDAVADPSPDPDLFTRSFVVNEDGTRTYSDWTQSSGGGTSPPATPLATQEDNVTVIGDTHTLDFRGAGVAVSPGGTSNEAIITIAGATVEGGSAPVFETVPVTVTPVTGWSVQSAVVEPITPFYVRLIVEATRTGGDLNVSSNGNIADTPMGNLIDPFWWPIAEAPGQAAIRLQFFRPTLLGGWGSISCASGLIQFTDGLPSTTIPATQQVRITAEYFIANPVTNMAGSTITGSTPPSIGVRATSADQPLADGIYTVVDFVGGTVDHNFGGTALSITPDSTFTVHETGVYLITAGGTVGSTTVAATRRLIGVEWMLDGAFGPPGSLVNNIPIMRSELPGSTTGGYGSLTVSNELFLPAGAVVRMYAMLAGVAASVRNTAIPAWFNIRKVDVLGIGPPGAQGPSGGTYSYAQAVAAATWVINHPLTFRPSVTVVDSTGRQVEGDVVYTDADTVTIGFSGAFAGTAYLS